MMSRSARAWSWSLVAGLTLAATSIAAPGAAQSWRTVTSSRQIDAEQDLRVEIKYGAGRLEVGPAEPGVLYRMQLRYDEEVFEPVTDYRNGRLELGVEGVDKNINLKKDHAGELNVRLARDVPMDLKLVFGAVRADIDLGGLSLTDLVLTTGATDARLDVSEPNPSRIRRAEIRVGAAEFDARSLGNLNAHRLSVEAGVGDVMLDLTGQWNEDGDVYVKMALGHLELRVPEGIGVRLVRDTFLTSLDADGFVKQGRDYYSLDWHDADRRITIEIDAAFGGIDVIWVR